MKILLVAFVFFSQLVLADDSLQTARAEYRTVPLVYTLEALVEAARQSTVSAQISGRINAVNFDVGDKVRKGQVIARIDPSEVDQSYNEASAQLAQADSVLENARASYQRSEHLFAQKFVSQAALDRARSEYDSAKAQAAARQANLNIAKTTRSYANVIAPYDGVVAERHVELGEMVAPGKPLMTGFDPSRLRVSVSIPQYRLDAVRAGKTVQVFFPAIAKTVTGRAVTVLPEANMLTHTTMMRIDLPENFPGIYPGMYAEAIFTVGQAKKLLIPARAVARRSEVTAVYIVDAGKISLRQVRLGEKSGEDVEVLSGLSENETVATDPVKAGMMLRGAR